MHPWGDVVEYKEPGGGNLRGMNTFVDMQIVFLSQRLRFSETSLSHVFSASLTCEI